MNGGPTNRLVFFGTPWPEVEQYRQVATPVGMTCGGCAERIEMGDQGIWRIVQAQDYQGSVTDHIPMHRGCAELSVES